VTFPTILVATWQHGVFAISGTRREQEFANHAARTIISDGDGGAFSIIDNRSVCHRAPNGAWTTIAAAEFDLSCLVKVGDLIYAGTDDARVLRVSTRNGTAGATFEQLRGFENVAGREEWRAGGAMVDGKWLGPPLGVRSISATSDAAVLLANVHVGGIPHSTDGGATWQPTIDIENDVHEVRAHPSRPNTVVAASAVGLCISTDAGARWTVERDGLYAPHCSAVAFAGDDVLISASTSPFSPEGALYRRGLDEPGPLTKIAGGLPEWLGGKIDTHCIATAAGNSTVAFVDMGGNLYISPDSARTWRLLANGLPMPSGILIL
jgi:hypothetical protein